MKGICGIVLVWALLSPASYTNLIAFGRMQGKVSSPDASNNSIDGTLRLGITLLQGGNFEIFMQRLTRPKSLSRVVGNGSLKETTENQRLLGTFDVLLALMKAASAAQVKTIHTPEGIRAYFSLSPPVAGRTAFSLIEENGRWYVD
jgi:hypothetical protein